MPLDASIPLQAKAPSLDESLKPLSSMLNIQNSMQQLKNSQLSNDVSSADFAEKNAIRTLAKDPSVQNPDGSLNQDKFVARAQVVAPTLGASVAQGNLGNQAAQIANRSNQFKLHQDFTSTALQTASGLINDPRISAPAENYDPEKASQALTEAYQQMINKGVPANHALTAVAPFMMKIQQPGEVRQSLLNTITGGLNAQGQASAIQPSGPVINNGQQQVQYNTNPIAGAIGPVNGVSTQNQLPPTTPTYNGTTPGYLGSQDEGAQGLDVSKLSSQQAAALAQRDPQAFANGVQHFQQTQGRGNGFVASGPSIGTSESIGGTVGGINDDWKKTQESTVNAQRDIGILQTIKQHATGAATGFASDKKALLAGLSDLLGMDADTLSKTDTDLLAKNANMLALAGGDTNMARTMAEAANPNTHMSKDAIIAASNQVIAQKKMLLAKQQFMTPFKAMADQGHPEMYNNALNQFNAVADPRVIQFKDMTPQERSAMKSSMTPQEQAAFRTKLDKAQQLGILQ